ncbi:MobF family relaxase [Sphingobium sp. TKS]|uniref:MobF family relaxase n=1 Tax=Sphingobium sp. TKS TaxID=1315974 RepID=UPI000770231C|nr:MobF family relaxase [Sphingobium sp. TKS]AMK26131.1 conjugative relaxase region-like protein [Sphingobium sp. TKS]
MLSVAPVRSASGAANYFAKDDYYTVEGSSEMTSWAGEGAKTLGLSGEVTKDAFEAALNGILPGGEAIAQVENRRAGVDLTFSMPKSASIQAYVAGDKRILEANMTAVRKTMAWVEQNLAQGRRDVEGRKVPIQSGNLVYALFQHDTSRALDPQGHIHAVIANLTQMPDGRWQALHADKIWAHNSVIGSIYHAHLRSELERRGYQIELKGRHGTFEIAGVSKAAVAEFSQRRVEILERATKLGISSPEGLREITMRSRDPKLGIEDRAALRQDWIDRAAALGFDGKGLALAAQGRAGLSSPDSSLERGYRSIVDAIDAARTLVGGLLGPHDPLVDNALARAVKSPAQARAQFAVASAVRILSEREAAWPLHKLAKTALDLGMKDVTIEGVEGRIGQLVQNRQLIPGVARAADKNGPMVTTPEALRTEEAILRLVDEGKDMAQPILGAPDAPSRLQDVVHRPLNSGQLGAATMILSSADRTVSVQGVAGAGKSTMLQAVAQVAKAEGRSITGLAFQNKMVADLAEGAGIEARTIASFVWANERYITERDTAGYEAARAALSGVMLVVDESSMVSSRDMLKLHQISDALGVDKLVLVGDRQQLSSIDAGKSFAMIQAGGSTVARMDENIRQRTDQLRTVAALANDGHARTAMKVLGERIIEHAQPAAAAADLWMALPASDRDVTAVFASGREARAIINAAIQDGLVAEGSVKGAAIQLTVTERVNMTREELRFASTYRPGQTLEVARGGARDIGIGEGRYNVLKVHRNGKVDLSDGKRKIRIDPQRLSPTEKRDRLQLHEKKTLQLREGDRIRWTANDKDRGLHNAAIARVVGVEAGGITVETADRGRLTLGADDPMLSRLDLAYALNMHMAQGVTTDKAIIVMSAQERNLSNQRLFNVGVTRVRDVITMVVDDREKLARQLDMNAGNKTSALETLGRLSIDGTSRQDPRGKFDPGSRGQLPDLPPLPGNLPPLPRGATVPTSGRDEAGLKAEEVARLLPLPERSLGLDL